MAVADLGVIEVCNCLVSFSPLIDRLMAYLGRLLKVMQGEFRSDTYLHVVVAGGVGGEMSLCSSLLFLSGPRNVDSQGLQYDSHALGVLWFRLTFRRMGR